MTRKIALLLSLSTFFFTASIGFTSCEFPQFSKETDTTQEETSESHSEDAHNWTIHEVVQAQTCTKDGIISYSCKCGEFKTEVQEAEGHRYGNWQNITEATCQSMGVKQKICKNCQHSEIQKTAIANHLYEFGACKWCNKSQNTNNNNSNSEQNGNSSTTPEQSGEFIENGLRFISNGNGTCFLSQVISANNNMVTIPDEVNGETVNRIGTNAFTDCQTVTKITIPASVTSIDDYAFVNCQKLQEISVATGNSVYSSENGILYNKAKTTLICYPSGKTASYFAIPEKVTAIGTAAFGYNETLFRIYVETDLTRIGDEAFGNCFRLSEVYYEGTEQRWQSVSIGSGNYALNLSEIYCNIDRGTFNNICNSI